MTEVYQAEYLTSIDQEIPVSLIWDSFLGLVKTIIKLDNKSWFGDVG